MPIYEFYCSACHKIFKFLARRPEAEKRPDCPKCGRKNLDRRFSLFAVSKGLEEGEGSAGEEVDLPVDESKLERAMEMLEGEAEGLEGDDPRHAAKLLRRLYDASGLELGPSLQEAIQRMEAGEDPETIEEELGDALEEEEPSSGRHPKDMRSTVKRQGPPAVDEALYDL